MNKQMKRLHYRTSGLKVRVCFLSLSWGLVAKVHVDFQRCWVLKLF